MIQYLRTLGKKGPPYSNEEVNTVRDLLNEGAVYVDDVSKFLNVPKDVVIEGLTGIPKGLSETNKISSDQAQEIEKLIKKGVMTVPEVSEYFGAAPEVVEDYLINTAGYNEGQLEQARRRGRVTDRYYKLGPAPKDQAPTPAAIPSLLGMDEDALRRLGEIYDNAAQGRGETLADRAQASEQTVASGATTSATQGAGNPLSSIAVDGDYSMDDARFVENLIRNGQVTIKEASDYFGIPIEAINRVLSTDFGYTPDQINSFGGGTYTGSNEIPAGSNEIPTGLRGSEQALREGATGAISMLDSLNRASRQDLIGGYSGGLESLGTAYDAARGFLTPYQTGGQGAFQRQQALSGALGQEAFNEAYQQSPYMRFLQEQGERSVLRNTAATGGLGGGNVQKELTRFGQGLASQGLQQDITNMANLANIGQQSARSLANLEMGLGQRQQQAQQGLAGLLSGSTSMYGMPVANQLSSLGVNLATGRTNAGQQLADQYGQAARALGNIYSGQGQNIQSTLGGQLGNILDLTNTAATNEALAQQGYYGNIANIQSGMGSNISGVPNSMINIPDYQTAVANALNAGQLGYDLGKDIFGNQQNQNSGRMNIGSYFPAGYFNQPTGPNPLAGVNAYQGAPQLNAAGQLTAVS